MTGKVIDDSSVRQYLTQVRTTVSTKGQIVLPAEIRSQDRILPGQEFQVERLEPGIYRLQRVRGRRNDGLVKLLESCPVRGWFEPLPRTESTDDVTGPRLG